jgi:aryl-alcohol dehydrogenase-like predicted oxidoreductase
MLPQMGVANTSAELVLGTAQLGLVYGAANRTGQPNAREAELILRSAVSAGVKWIDTAAAYGSAEQRIGAALPGAKGVRVVTKLDPLSEITESSGIGDIRIAVAQSVRRSCAKLGTDRLEVLLLHRAHHLTMRNGAIWSAVKQMRDEGVIYDLGVSVYSPQEAMAALADRDVRHIQLPFNALDWRWRAEEFREALARRPGVTIHARSPLLQGLLAGHDDARWPQGIDPADVKRALIKLTRDLDRDSPADLCLAYARAQSWIDGVVVGMENLSQLALNLALFKRPPLTKNEIEAVDANLPHASERLLNPALWAAAA